MKRVISLCLILGLLCGCAGGSEVSVVSAGAEAPVAAYAVFDRQIFAMDTFMDLRAYGPEAEAALAEAGAMIERLDGLLSVTNAESEIYRINHSGSGAVSPETEELISQALELSRAVGDALDITIYPVSRAWGFTTGEYQIPDPAVIDALLPLVDDGKVTLADGAVTIPAGAELDLGAVAKGYAGDLAAELLKARGVTSALLNLGGSTIRTLGQKPDGSNWRIAIQDPEDPEGYAGVMELGEGAVDTSGGYERYFVGEDGEVYWHILDPVTGYPAKSGLISVTVLSDATLVGDALSTALFVMGLDGAIEYWRETGGFEFVLIDEEHRVYVSEGASDCFTPTGAYASAAVTVIPKHPEQEDGA